MTNKKIAIITARGGSKRIPKKNIKNFCGKPIIAYSIEAAIKSDLFDEIMVSTDDGEIAKIAESYGANVPFMRSAETSSDFATTADVIIEVLTQYQKINMNFQYACCIYPTAPFVTPEKLKVGMDLLQKKDAIEVMPVIPFSYPPQRCYIIENNYLKMKWKENLNKRSQDLEVLYHDCGQFYCYNIEKFLSAGGQVSEDIIPIVLNEMEVQDIDNETDWKLAETKYKLLNNNFVSRDTI